MKSWISAFLFGCLFAFGLALGGMTKTPVVQEFLDVTGEWNPALLLVMIAALVVHGLTLHKILKRRAPLLEKNFHLPTGAHLDKRLILGAAIFGVGWGLLGYCPGPALVAFGAQMSTAVVFVPAMVFGMWLAQRIPEALGTRQHQQKTDG